MAYSFDPSGVLPVDAGEQNGNTAVPPPASDVLRALRAAARAGERPSAFLRQVAGRYALPVRDFVRVLGDAFAVPIRTRALLAIWPPVGTGTVTDGTIDAEFGAAIAATREIWDAGGWPFADSEFMFATTTERVLTGDAPILSARREAGISLWHFHNEPPCDLGGVAVAILWQVLQLDPTVGELADLPAGWVAERDAVGLPWRRGPATD